MSLSDYHAMIPRHHNLTRARSLRRDPTDAERMLWKRLRHRQIDGAKFRRQRPIGNYIVDFVCLEAMLVVEVDGSQHVRAIQVRCGTDGISRSRRLRGDPSLEQ